jgi:hypothetical protein
MFPERIVIRVMSKWHPEGECWISDYSRGSHGYAQIGWHGEDGRKVATTVHRVAWWAANRQPIEKGMTIDHICKVRACINPLHLRLLSNEENASDNGQVRVNLPTGRLCHKGHPLIRDGNGRTYCRDCQNERTRKRRRKF